MDNSLTLVITRNLPSSRADAHAIVPGNIRSITYLGRRSFPKYLTVLGPVECWGYFDARAYLDRGLYWD